MLPRHDDRSSAAEVRDHRRGGAFGSEVQVRPSDLPTSAVEILTNLAVLALRDGAGGDGAARIYRPLPRDRGRKAGTALEPPYPVDVAEIDVPAGDPDRVRASFRGRNCVIPRGALSDKDFDAVAGRVEPWPRRRVEEGLSVPVEFRKTPEDGRRRLVELLRESGIADRVVEALGERGGRGWAPMDNGTWWSRWREPRPQRVGSYHTGYPVNADRSDWFTVWMPFARCGPGIAGEFRFSRSSRRGFSSVRSMIRRVMHEKVLKNMLIIGIYIITGYSQRV